MLKSPVLLESELDAVRSDSALQAQTFSLHYAAGSPSALQEALAELCKQVRRAGGGRLPWRPGGQGSGQPGHRAARLPVRGAQPCIVCPVCHMSPPVHTPTWACPPPSEQVEGAVRAGCQCVVLSDKGAMDAQSPPIPPLLATGAVHHHLIRAGEWPAAVAQLSFTRVLCRSWPA